MELTRRRFLIDTCVGLLGASTAAGCASSTMPAACCTEAPARCGIAAAGASGANLPRCELYAFDEMQRASAIVVRPDDEASLA